MSKEGAIERAKSMANAKIETLSGNKIKKYNIKSNPYHRKHKLHAVWHNAFYDECKRIGRHIQSTKTKPINLGFFIGR